MSTKNKTPAAGSAAAVSELALQKWNKAFDKMFAELPPLGDTPLTADFHTLPAGKSGGGDAEAINNLRAFLKTLGAEENRPTITDLFKRLDELAKGGASDED